MSLLNFRAGWCGHCGEAISDPIWLQYREDGHLHRYHRLCGDRSGEEAYAPADLVLSVPMVTILYQNHRGILDYRRIKPVHFWFGTTLFYSKPQHLLDAYDLKKNAWRTFAMANISSWAEQDAIEEPRCGEPLLMEKKA